MRHSWTWLVLASGLGLVALLVFDLSQTVRAQEDRARVVALRDAERGARELRTTLGSPAVLERVPPERRFELRDGVLLVPAVLGWLEPPPSFDPERELDPVARDLWARAERAPLEEAGQLWRTLEQDPTLRPAARSWLAVRMAWFAQRRGEHELRDARLERLDDSAPDQVAASALLLCAHAELPLPEWALGAIPRLEQRRGDALIERLAELGLDVSAERRACEAAREQRATLRAVSAHAASLAASARSELRAVDGALLMYFPEREAGARLSEVELRALISSLVERGLEGAPALALGGSLSSADGAQPAIEGLLGVSPQPLLSRSLTSGPVGLALLAFGLAAICGGGVILALRGARREAQAAELRSEFVTGVTHELKTPLAGIRLTAELLADGHVEGAQKQREYLARLSGEAQRLGGLIENVLDLGRLERGERGHHPERADLVQLTTETLALFEPLATRAELQLAFEAPAGEVWVDVDRDALRQALFNVLDNARKYGAGKQRIELGLQIEQGTARLHVRDHGPGVPAHERELVFERFRRGARQRDGRVPGVGLGLYLARTLLRRQGGELRCVEAPDGEGGARFEFLLPVTRTGAET